MKDEPVTGPEAFFRIAFALLDDLPRRRALAEQQAEEVEGVAETDEDAQEYPAEDGPAQGKEPL